MCVIYAISAVLLAAIIWWITSKELQEKFIHWLVNRDNETAARLKCYADWFSRVSSAFYVGIVLAFLQNMLQSQETILETPYMLALGLLFALLASVPLQVSLLYAEAAKRKEDQERNTHA